MKQNKHDAIICIQCPKRIRNKYFWKTWCQQPGAQPGFFYGGGWNYV